MMDCWDDVAVGIKVEVVNTDCDNFSEEYPDYYWVASIIKIAGMLFLKSCSTLLLKLIN